MLEAAGEGQLERLDQRAPVLAGHERQGRFGVRGEDGLPGADRDVGAEGEEVVVALAQERVLGTGARGIEPGIDGALVVVGLVAHLGAGGETRAAAAAPQATEASVGLQVPDEQARAAEAVLIAVDLVQHRRRVGEGPVHRDQVVDDAERDGERVEGGLVGAGEGAAELRLADLEALVLVRLGAGGHERALPLPRVAQTAAEAAEHAPSVAPDLGDAGIEALAGDVGVLARRDAGPEGDIRRLAGQAGGAVGVGRAGRMVEAHAERVPRVGGGQVDAGVVGVLEIDGLAAGAAVGAVEEEVAEEIHPVVERPVDEGGELHPVGRGHEDLPLVPVRVGGVLRAVDVLGEGGLLEADAGRAGPEVEHPVRREAGDARGRRGRGGDTDVARGARPDEGAEVGLDEAALPLTPLVHVVGVGEVVVADGRAVGVDQGHPIPRGGQVAAEAQVELPGKAALRRGEGVAVEVVQRVGDVEAARLEAGAVGRARLVGPAVLGHRAAQGELAAGVAAGHAVVDHPGRRIRTIDGGGAVAQHLDPLDQGARHGVDVHREGRHAVLRHRDRMGHQPAAIEEGQGAAGTDAAQVDGGDVAAGQLGAIVDLGDRRGLGHAEGLEQLCHRGGAARL